MVKSHHSRVVEMIVGDVYNQRGGMGTSPKGRESRHWQRDRPSDFSCLAVMRSIAMGDHMKKRQELVSSRERIVKSAP